MKLIITVMCMIIIMYCDRTVSNVNKLGCWKSRVCVFTSSVHTDAKDSVGGSVFLKLIVALSHIFLCSSHINHIFTIKKHMTRDYQGSKNRWDRSR